MKEKAPRYLRLLLSIVMATVLASLIVLIVGWIAKWNTSRQFSDGFFIAGAVFALLGFLAVLGGFTRRTDFKITYSQSARDASLAERARLMMEDIRQGYGLLILLVGSSVFLIVISVLVSL